ncbi:mucin-20 isoform X2 [Phyllostomus discolor]|nr:mucin-20 isoform X2 [Phyllostomus discolor]XP_035874142.1 mucin-20 isoform X2 [Phyllostomus discolor]
MNHTELPAVTLGINTSSAGASQTIGLAEPSVQSHIPLETQTVDTQTFDRILIPASTISESETRETKTIFSATETRALTKITPSKFMVVMTVPMETSATSGSSSEARATTVETVTGSDLLVFGILCTDDSSEETKRITTDALPLAHMSAEARALALESNSVLAITSSQTLAPDITVPSKALVAYTIADIAVTNCSIIELETTAIIAGTSDIDHSPTGGRGTLSTPETSALPDFTEAKSHLTRIMTSSETLSTASTTESVTPDTTVETPHTTNSTTEGESTAAQAATSSGTLMTISINPLEQTLPLSVETASHTKVSGAVTISTEAGSTVGKVTSFAGSSGMIYSLSETAPIQKYTRSETSTTHSTTSGPVPISRSSIPSVLTTTNSSQETDITSAKATASAKTSKTASTAGGKPTATPTTSQTRWTTEDTTDGDEGFLLLRLSVASPEDLTDPRVAKRLMYQLHHELHTHMPPTQISLLHVRRD